MPNTENLLIVREAIRAESVAKFNMGEWAFYEDEPSCGTAGCIAGFTNILFKVPRRVMAEGIIKTAGQPLGLDFVVAKELFLPKHTMSSFDGEYYLEDITRADAIAAIDNVIEHGEPRWADVIATRPHSVDTPPPSTLPASITAALDARAEPTVNDDIEPPDAEMVEKLAGAA